MTGKRAENVYEFRAYIKGRSLLSIKAVDIHREVCDIYGDVQQQLKDAASRGRPAITTTKGNKEKIENILKTDAPFTIRQLA